MLLSKPLQSVSADVFFSFCNLYLFAGVVTPAPFLLLLNCLVLGHDSGRIFPVKIDRNKNVGCLKEAIKEAKKPAFDDIDADSLEIWKVSIPVDEDTDLQVEVKKLRLPETKSLLPVHSLSGIFQNVVEESLHVIVRPGRVSVRPIFACPF